MTGNTALHLACTKRHVNICQLLITGKSVALDNKLPRLKKVADITKCNKDNNTVLHCAVTIKLIDVIRFLLDKAKEFTENERLEVL